MAIDKPNFWSRLFNRNKEEAKAEIQKKEEPQAHFSTLLHTDYYDGEKNEGEMGLAKNYVPLYETLRVRSWQAYYESDVTQMVLRKFLLWAIGSGLKLQSEPVKNILEKSNIKLNREKFTEEVESAWKIWASSNESDYTKKFNLNHRQSEVYKNAFIGGDCLVILRIQKGVLNVQSVDGSHVSNPTDRALVQQAKERKNRIENGIELNAKNEHVAFYVYDTLKGGHVRVKARDRRGRKVAYLVYGMKYRIDHERGIPTTAVILQRLKSMDRYSDAAITSAEERAKIPFFIQHGPESTGENPMVSQVQASLNIHRDAQPSGSYESGIEVARKISFTENKTVHNLPPDSKIQAIESDNEINVRDFLTTYIDLICSTIGIPPEVAKSQYNSNFSASRAAIGDWQHTLTEARKDFSTQFLTPIYTLWLDLQILSRKIDAPGYFDAIINNDTMALAAYRNARFIGAKVPHIDPVKEVKAERMKLGSLADHVPLTTIEQATENVGQGDYESNTEQFQKELEKSPKQDAKE